MNDSEQTTSEEKGIDFSRIVELPTGVRVINATSHKITFIHGDKVISVEPSGATLKAAIGDEVVEIRGSVEIVQSKYLPTAEGI